MQKIQKFCQIVFCIQYLFSFLPVSKYRGASRGGKVRLFHFPELKAEEP